MPTLFALAQSGQDVPSSNDESQLVCVPFGTCEPCPDDAVRRLLALPFTEHPLSTQLLLQMNEPFCQPFGNRRLMHCTPSSSSPSSPNSLQQPHPPQNHPSTHQSDHIGEIPAWESCGRIVEKERGDFYEFLACNVVIALIAVGVVLFRSKQLRAMQARQLAARIGLTRRVPGGWVG